MRTVLLMIFLSSLLSSCREDGCNPMLNFSGITERDENGKLITTDENDWKLKDHWQQRERALFDKAYDNTCVAPPNFSVMAYPNPNQGTFQIVFNKSNATTVDLRLVDFDCRRLITVDGITSNSIALQPENYNKEGIVRLFYRFIEDGCEYQGHGDIMIRKDGEE